MYKGIIRAVAIFAVSLPGSAQVSRRQAAIVGNNASGQGRCVVQVIVDGTAEVTLQGASGSVRDLSGRPAQWQRFECTGAIPSDPANFQFRALDGRGRQQLVRDPRNGGLAAVRIEDNDGGAGAYTFEVDWTDNGRNYPGYQSNDRGYHNGGGNVYSQNRDMTGADPTDACRSEVRQEAARQFGTGDILFENSRIDHRDNRNDRVVEGTFVLRRDRDRDQPHRFVCSLDPDGDRVRSVMLDSNGPPQRSGYGSADREMDTSRVAADSCRRAVDNRMRGDGYGDVRFGEINMNNGRNGWLEGTVSGDRGNGMESLHFGCRIDPNDGDVRSVDLRRR